MTLTAEKLALINSVVINGSSQASSALTRWFNRRVHIHTSGLTKVTLYEIQMRFRAEDEEMVAVYHEVQGAIEGHLLLAFPIKTALILIDLMMQQPIGTATSIGEMEESIIMETGNIVSSAFTSNLADSVHENVLPSIPLFAHDYGAAIMDHILQDQFEESNEALILPSSFEFEEIHVSWMMYVLPSEAGFERMDELLG